MFLREQFGAGTSATKHGGLSLPVGVTLMLLGLVVNICTAVRYRQYLRALDEGNFRSAFGTTFAMFIVGALTVGGVGPAIYRSTILI